MNVAQTNTLLGPVLRGRYYSKSSGLQYTCRFMLAQTVDTAMEEILTDVHNALLKCLHVAMRTRSARDSSCVHVEEYPTRPVAQHGSDVLE
jgi:hypothetical protein